VSAAFFWIRFVGERAEFVRKIFFAAVDFEFAVGAERGHFFRADGQLNHAGVKVLNMDAVVLVILGLQTERVGFECVNNIFGTRIAGFFRLRFLDARGQQ